MFNIKNILFVIFIIAQTVLAANSSLSQTNSVHKLVKFYLDLSLDSGALLEGYSKEVSGQTMSYHSSEPGVTEALISRATNGAMSIEWQTAPLPREKEDYLSFIWLAGLGVNIGEYKFDLFINDEKWLTFTSIKKSEWTIKGKNNSQLHFFSNLTDDFGDFFGYMILKVPSDYFPGNEPLKLKVVGEAAQSLVWYMTFKHNRVAHQIAQTRNQGFWYTLKWQNDQNKFDLVMSRLLAGESIRIEDTNGYRSTENLKSIGEESVASFSFPSNLQVPLSIYLNGKMIDRLDSLNGTWETQENFEDGKVVCRTRYMSNNSNVLECSGNYFLNVVDGLRSLNTSYFRDGEIHLVTSSHQDIAWMDSPQNCIIQRDTMVVSPALEMLKKNPAYHYSVEQALMLKEYLERHPQKLAEIIQYTKEGRLEWGASYNQPYEGMYSGESLIRQFYFGRKWIKKILPGCDSRLAWNLDVPGRTLQMPQIMKKSGVNYLLLSRHKRGFFYWQSPDGSRIGAHSSGHYHWASQFLRQGTQNSILEMPGMIQSWEKDFEQSEMAPILPVVFASDMSKPKDFSELLNSWNNFKIRSNDWQKIVNPKIPIIKYDIAENALDNIFKSEPDLPVIQGERPNVWLYIHGPTHHKAISASREGARVLTAAEKFSAINTILEENYRGYPADVLANAWESHIYPDHGWGGKNGHITDSLFQAKSEFARDEGNRVLKRALSKISQKIKSKPSLGIPIVVFNDLSWQRNDPVSCNVKFEKGRATTIQLIDENEEKIPFELFDSTYYDDGSLKNAGIIFIAENVPSIGYKTYYVGSEKKSIQSNKIGQFEKTFENDFYRIDFVKGGISQIYDKQLNQELFNTKKFLAGDMIMLKSEGNGAGEFAEVQQPTMEGFDKISHYQTNWKLISDGDVAAVFGLKQTLANLTYQLHVTLYKQIKRIDFNVDLLNWNGAKNREFRLTFPLKMENAKVTYEVPFGTVTVGEDEISGAAGERYVQPASGVRPREVQDWIHASDQKLGITLSSSVAVCDYSDPTDNPVDYPIIQPVLLASRRSCHGEGNWYLQEGDHHFSFSLFSHKPGWVNGFRWGKQPNHPLRAVIKQQNLNDSFLPEQKSFCEPSAQNIIVSTIKKCDDDNSIILRCFDLTGKDTEVTINWFGKIETLEHTNLIEEEGKLLHMIGENIKLKIGHHAIETIKIYN